MELAQISSEQFFVCTGMPQMYRRQITKIESFCSMVPNLADYSKVVRITSIALIGKGVTSVANRSSKAVQERIAPIKEIWGEETR